ncbi:phosphatidylserine decarboxylase family protein [Xanthomonas nasturtii]|uniref:phosphatidylserine decarboxylase family protein n=1 Tax=Xanthomonas nasturtii TaxID=1843581 RepID=UPI0020117B6E|nr:phosphatidylserine decarboxylase family protein [Xanthomonas nasturtii]MCL1501288.1 phosphatidylserine decarboxylase family protein [Xanthomonas nasturtii]MCL1505111.1 phosphatidylserine decarboxylase family protein [Xanthomonas nasturtii]MCL1524658.1 phosphatidylserine decarboxylase family protein [Xanthomonas nasturtii]
MTTASHSPIAHRVGQWLPSDQHVMDTWLSTLVSEVDADTLKGSPRPLHPVIEDFKALIERDAQIYMLFHQMFAQVPHKPPYNRDPTGKPQVRDYHVMLKLFNAIMTRAPEFNKTGLVGFPINAILDWPMGTGSGVSAFLNEKVNAAFRAMLNEWARFLASPDSTYVLNTDPVSGWFGRDAKTAMPHFATNFVCDPAAPHYGFTSWDDFFTRRFRPGVRPIDAPEDDAVIVNACESAPYRLAHSVQLRDRFWIKAQPYSLDHMLAQDAYVGQFVGGTVYQAFLDALSYHRWHSPVSGRVVKTHLQPGTYYAEALAEGFDPVGPNSSQAYITELATRAMIYIQADNPAIGMMCFMAVGMAEVSTCELGVYAGQYVKKGDPLGMFHFGGSTHCLIFRPGVKLTFDLHGQTPGLNSKNIPVNARIASVIA